MFVGVLACLSDICSVDRYHNLLGNQADPSLTGIASLNCDVYVRKLSWDSSQIVMSLADGMTEVETEIR